MKILFKLIPALWSSACGYIMGYNGVTLKGVLMWLIGLIILVVLTTWIIEELKLNSNNPTS